MGGSVKRSRAVALRSTWARHFKHTVLMGDVDDPSVGMITLPELRNRTTYNDAQQRSLRSLLYGVAHLPPGARWVFMVDDDTWVNPAELAKFLFPLEWRLPAVVGFIIEDPGMGLTSWIAGGSGMLLSLEAAKLLAAQLYTPHCRAAKADYNDLTLGECAWLFGVGQVMSPLFDFHGKVLATNNRELRITEALAYVTVHKVYEQRMAEMYAQWEARVAPWWVHAPLQLQGRFDIDHE